MPIIHRAVSHKRTAASATLGGMAIRQPDDTHLPILATWITRGLAMIAGAARRWRHAPAVPSPGFVSHQWLTEYRLSHFADLDW
jgi:hypothetical protein